MKMKKAMKKRSPNQSSRHLAHQKSPSEPCQISIHPISLSSNDHPLPYTPPSSLSLLDPSPSRVIPSGLVGKCLFKPPGQCTSNPQQVMHTVLTGFNIPLYRLVWLSPSLYISAPLRDFLNQALQPQLQQKRVWSIEVRIVVHGSDTVQSAPRTLSSPFLLSTKRVTNQRFGVQAIQAVLRYKSNYFSDFCLLIRSFQAMAENRQQPAAQEGAARQGNPLDRVIGNDTRTLCKEHVYMIARFVKHHKELRDDFELDSRSKRKKLIKQRKEIEGLKAPKGGTEGCSDGRHSKPTLVLVK